MSADAAAWIPRVVTQFCPQAVRCADPFHVVKWATEALDQVRRQTRNALRRQPGGTGRDRRGRRASTGPAQSLKRARWALWKNPENLTELQHHKLTWIAKTEPRLHSPTYSKKDSATSSPFPATTANTLSTSCSPGPLVAACGEFVKLGRFDHLVIGTGEGPQRQTLRSITSLPEVTNRLSGRPRPSPSR